MLLRVEIANVRYGLSRGLECGEGLDHPERRLCVILLEESVECMSDFGICASHAECRVYMVTCTKKQQWTKLVSIHCMHVKLCC